MVICCLEKAGELQKRIRAVTKIILFKTVEWKKNFIFKLYKNGVLDVNKYIQNTKGRGQITIFGLSDFIFMVFFFLM